MPQPGVQNEVAQVAQDPLGGARKTAAACRHAQSVGTSTAQTPLPGLRIVRERFPTACAVGYFRSPLPGLTAVKARCGSGYKKPVRSGAMAQRGLPPADLSSGPGRTAGRKAEVRVEVPAWFAVCRRGLPPAALKWRAACHPRLEGQNRREERKHDHHRHRRIRNQVEKSSVDPFSHQVPAVDEYQNQNQDDRQQNAVEHL